MTAYASPGHVTAGTTATSAWAAAVSDGMDYIAATDRWRVSTTDNATNNFTTATAKVVTWELETYDAPNGVHAPSANKVIIVNPGLYLVRARLAFVANSAGTRQVWIAKGPTSTTPGLLAANIVVSKVDANAGASAASTPFVEDEVQCSVGDVLWVVGVQNSGGALAVDTTAYGSVFAGRWVASS